MNCNNQVKLSWIIGGQLDEIVFFLVAFGIAINLILFVIHFCSDCLCCVENKYYYYYSWIEIDESLIYCQIKYFEAFCSW